MEIEHLKEDLKLSIAQRIKESSKLFKFCIKIHPEYIYKPFIKSFSSWEEYREWQKKQTNPLFW